MYAVATANTNVAFLNIFKIVNDKWGASQQLVADPAGRRNPPEQCWLDRIRSAGQPRVLPSGWPAGRRHRTPPRRDPRQRERRSPSRRRHGRSTGAERTATATAVEARIINDTDGNAVKEAIVNKINEMTDLDALSLAAISGAVWANGRGRSRGTLRSADMPWGNRRQIL